LIDSINNNTNRQLQPLIGFWNNEWTRTWRTSLSRMDGTS